MTPSDQPEMQYMKVYYFDAAGAVDADGNSRKVVAVVAEGGADAIANYVRLMKGHFCNPRFKVLGSGHAWMVRRMKEGRYLQIDRRGHVVEGRDGGLGLPADKTPLRLDASVKDE
jgi:hypothetical protein